LDGNCKRIKYHIVDMLGQQKPTISAIILKYTFGISVIAFIICMMSIALHFMGIPIFSFVAGDPGIIPIPAPTSEQMAFTTFPITSDLSCNFFPVASTQYTIAFDVYIMADFITSTVPKVILYRSAYPISIQNTDTMDSLSSLFGNSNIIVYLDPLTNDLYAAALKTDSTYITSQPIKNVPLRTPFRITVVVSDNFLELYLNGDLKQVLPFNGGVIASPTSTYFFGPPPIVNQSVNIGNIHLWNSELSSKIVHSFGQIPVNSQIFKNKYNP